MLKKPLAEFLGTFILVFTGTGAIIINEATNGAIGNTGIAIAFGLAVTTMIFTFGQISGAHLNPAVTLAFAAAGRFNWSRVPSYISAQILGAICASALLALLFPLNQLLGSTQPSGSIIQTLILEIILATILMLVILSTTSGAKEKGISAAIAIGAAILLEALFAGPITGASMNPARSIGPAIISLHIKSLWIYIIAPITGALIAIPLCKATHDNKCCPGKCI